MVYLNILLLCITLLNIYILFSSHCIFFFVIKIAIKVYKSIVVDFCCSFCTLASFISMYHFYLYFLSSHSAIWKLFVDLIFCEVKTFT